MSSGYRKRGHSHTDTRNVPPGHTEAHRDNACDNECEIGVMGSHAKGHQGCLAATRSWRRRGDPPVAPSERVWPC